MKNNKFTKFSLVILTVALCLGTAFAISTLAADNDTTPVISSQNIMYSDKYSLMYAIPAQTVKNGAEGSVNIYVHKGTEPTAETYENGTSYRGVFAAANTKGLDYDAFIFITDGIGAKEFATQYYVVAKDNTSGKFSALTRYSVAEYLYESLTFSDRNEWQRTMYQSSIDFATSVQVTVGEASERLDPEKDKDKLIKNLRYVVVEGGKIDGYNTGVYALGTTLAPVADTATELKWAVTTTADGKETVSNGNTSFTVIDAVKTVFTLGNKESINYRDEAKDFEDKTAGSAIDFATATDGVEAKYVTDANKGIVASATFNANQASLIFNTFSEEVCTKGNANAIEVSFDIKMDFTGDTDNYASIMTHFGHSNTRYNRAGWYNNGGSLKFRAIELSGYPWTETGLSYDADWMHMRVVIYTGTKNVYYYINGSETPIVQQINGSTDIDISVVNSFNMYADKGNAGLIGSNIKLDNVFCGYINETIPQ